MKLKEVYIDISSTYVDYHIKLKHNINILIGDSASGKSMISKLLMLVKKINNASSKGDTFKKDQNDENKNVMIKSTYPVMELTDDMFALLVESGTKSTVIFIVDEDSQFLSKNEFSRFIKTSGCYFLIISRDEEIIDEPFDVESIYHFKEEIVDNKTVNSLESHYSNFISEKYDGYDLYTEDTKSGKYLCEALGYKVKKGLGGNGKIKLFLSGIKTERVSLFADLYAFGQVMPSVVGSMKYNKINLLDCKSTEYILLKNKRLTESLSEEDLIWDFKRYKSLEKVYTHLLKLATKRVFGKQYSKGEDIISLIDDCILEEMRRIFEGESSKVANSKRLVDLI